ncbi:MAG: tyrosine-type recombinase/integrase [Ardenticatenaceae bacterium]|nr:tyrosine-type recombinase/integrase [Ardenticatenaceae bacterium]
MGQRQFPLSNRDIPTDTPLWLYEIEFLLKAGENSAKTESTYRSGLRLFADWLQHFKKDGYSADDPWPLSPRNLQTDTVVSFRRWLISNRSPGTVVTYTAAVVGYLSFLEDRDALPETIRLGKLQRQIKRRRARTNPAETVVDLDEARQAIPQIVNYYDELPLPAENDRYNRRLTLLRNRALVKMLYSTAARISEIVSLNRTTVRNGRSNHAIITGKGNKTRSIHIRPYAQNALQHYLDERKDLNPALFVAHSRNAQNARLTITSVHNVVKKAVKALNLHTTLSAHDFRHYRATQLLREGMPIEVVQEFLGHADIATTRNIYAPLLGVQIVDEWLENVDISPTQAAKLHSNDLQN